MRKVTNRRKYYPQAWQTDPSLIDTETVQYWRDGVMLTAQMKKERARELVETGQAFVITGQAIGTILNGECRG